MFLTVLNYIGVTLFAIFFFSLCIFIHELGHFLVAKWRKLHINAFSLGFKKIWGITYKGVEYRIGCLPFGGYVDIPQLEPTEEIKDQDGNPLPPIKPIDRILTAFAGPFANILMGFFLGIFIWIFGVPQDTPKMRSIEVAMVEAGSPEEKAGLQKGDIITEINGKSFYSTWNEVVTKILLHTGEVTLTVKRGDKNLNITYLPAPNPKRMPDEKLAYPFFEPNLPVVLYPEEGSPAAKAGIKADDRVIAINGVPLNDYTQFVEVVSAGKKMDMTVERNGTAVEIKNIEPVKTGQGDFRIGIRFDQDLKIAEIMKNTPAEKAGLKTGDIISSIDSKKLDSTLDAISIINNSMGKKLKMEVLRNGKTEKIELAPVFVDFYSIGVMLVHRNYPSPWNQFVSVIDMSVRTLKGVFSKKSTIGIKNFSGPANIVRIIIITAYHGLYSQTLYLVVMITFSLGLLNLLPLPVLDGGHISMAVVETIIRRPLPHELVRPVTIFFAALLVCLMLFITVFDMKRVYSGFRPKAEPVPASIEKQTTETPAKADEKQTKKP